MGWAKICDSRAFYGNFCNLLESLTNFGVASVFWLIYYPNHRQHDSLTTEYRHTKHLRATDGQNSLQAVTCSTTKQKNDRIARKKLEVANEGQ